MSIKESIKAIVPKTATHYLRELKNSNVILKLINTYLLDTKSGRNDASFAGEYKILDQLASELNIKNGFVVDVAASDGYNQSCTLGFFRRKGWAGLAIEMDPMKFSTLAFLYRNFPNAKLARNRVTPYNIKPLLNAYEVPKDISILNLDIDSYDLCVLDEMLKAGSRPRIISMEINEKIPSGIYFSVEYDDKHYWQNDHFYGCSIDAASSVVKPFGYILYLMEFNNAIFLRKDSISSDFVDLPPEIAYNTGYKDRPDRQELFPWNSDVEQWLHVNRDDSIELIKMHFSKYEGKFTIRKAQQT